jgi:hypothetical protein
MKSNIETSVVSSQPLMAIFSFFTSAPRSIFSAPYLITQLKKSNLFFTAKLPIVAMFAPASKI